MSQELDADTSPQLTMTVDEFNEYLSKALIKGIRAGLEAAADQIDPCCDKPCCEIEALCTERIRNLSPEDILKEMEK